ncbi:MAG: cytochrome c oxidase subunit II [Bacteroidales bacterium]|nr:cytochrome c oxidase subunit II [Bacteroidales bacterium]MCF8349550.1 cytochrome c oxidase subunit II [Bacteroidales bacterium]MCF8375109.1 cytochrome c oxidase subunit II [Bacteroidales bacterium]MCF8400016.1 cytochrome c oxidase subunit II [Bacteroidales bacterium]
MNQASNFVEGVDLSFYIILGISVFFLVGITATMIWFVVRYRKSKSPKAKNIEGNNKLEILWTVIPTLLVLVMFYYGWTEYEPMRKVPKDAMVVKAHGQMWSWSFEYDDGRRSEELVVPLNKPVKLELISHDVLHSLYIPAFRIKEDLVPGKDNYMWFLPQKVGEYDIFCAEYCGERHSYMLSMVRVLTEQEYNTWYEEKLGKSDDPPGLQILKQNACLSCHSRDGTEIVGPTFKGIWGRNEVVITDGEEREITVDKDYILHSIYEPDADVVKGFNAGQMISYKNTISEEQIDQIIEYLKTLQ